MSSGIVYFELASLYIQLKFPVSVVNYVGFDYTTLMNKAIDDEKICPFENHLFLFQWQVYIFTLKGKQ